MKKSFFTEQKKCLLYFSVITLIIWTLTYFGPSQTVWSPLHAHLFLKSIIATALILLIFPKHVFKPWAWFSAIYIPLTAAWIIFVAPVQATALLTTKDELSDIFGVLYLVVSMLIALSVTVHRKLKGRG